MRRIIYNDNTGRLWVVQPAYNNVDDPADMTDAEKEQRAFDKLPADAIDPQWIDEADVPKDRSQRDKLAKSRGAH